MTIATSAIGFFLPIFAFLLVFVVVYAMLKKSEVLGDNDFTMILIAFILASFFIVQANLVEFIRFTSAWTSVIAISVFLIVILLALIPGKLDDKTMGKIKPVFALAALVVMLLMFMFSAGYIFDLAINVDAIAGFLSKEWVGGILLIVIAVAVASQMKKDK